jgi:hypothetical protein
MHPADRAVQGAFAGEEFGFAAADGVEGQDLAEGECGHGNLLQALTVRPGAGCRESTFRTLPSCFGHRRVES